MKGFPSMYVCIYVYIYISISISIYIYIYICMQLILMDRARFSKTVYSMCTCVTKARKGLSFSLLCKTYKNDRMYTKHALFLSVSSDWSAHKLLARSLKDSYAVSVHSPQPFNYLHSVVDGTHSQLSNPWAAVVEDDTALVCMREWCTGVRKQFHLLPTHPTWNEPQNLS